MCDQELDFRFRNYSHPRSTRGLRCLLALSTARLTRASACLFYLTFTKSQLSAGCTRGSVHTSMRGKHVYTWRTSGIECIQSRCSEHWLVKSSRAVHDQQHPLFDTVTGFDPLSRRERSSSLVLEHGESLRTFRTVLHNSHGTISNETIFNSISLTVSFYQMRVTILCDTVTLGDRTARLYMR